MSSSRHSSVAESVQVGGSTTELEIARDLSAFYDDPLGFVMYAYPWDSDPSIQLVKLPKKWRKRYASEYGPDDWACGLLEEWGQEIASRGFDGITAVEPINATVASGHGIGKSGFTAWAVDFIMSTRPFAQGTVTANTATQLQTKTWAQIVKWTSRCITGHWFQVSTGKGNMAMRHRKWPGEWFCTGITCRKENAEAFHGQHAPNSTSFYIFDEASAIPNEIKEASDGGLTDGEPMRFAWGNPTRNSGWFYDSHHRGRLFWHIRRQIDSRSVQITNKAYLQSLIDENGEDSDYVRYKVKGKFPRASSLQLIPTDIIEKGMRRKPVSQIRQPLICGIDVAREGDDRSVIRFRRGLDAKAVPPPIKIRGADGDTIASKVAAVDLELRQQGFRRGIDALFVDATGGWGWAVIDALKRLKFRPVPINFAASASHAQYANKRTEMWFAIRSWLKEGGALDEDDDLQMELESVEYGHSQQRDALILEKKKDIKERLGWSPDDGDALALTFAHPVKQDLDGKPGRAKRDHDPYAEA